jgi:hypothetical protein
MEQLKSSNPQQGRRSAGRPGLRAALAALWIAALSTACLAAEPISGLESAFRPQGDGAPLDANGDRSDGRGLRVVVSSASRSVATIDGKVVHVGDTVNGMRVARITPQGVVLTGEGGVTERLVVSPSVVKLEHPANSKRISNGARQ